MKKWTGVVFLWGTDNATISYLSCIHSYIENVELEALEQSPGGQLLAK